MQGPRELSASLYLFSDRLCLMRLIPLSFERLWIRGTSQIAAPRIGTDAHRPSERLAIGTPATESAFWQLPSSTTQGSHERFRAVSLVLSYLSSQRTF